jgi:3-methyladenine DNA glycosylase AlkD
VIQTPDAEGQTAAEVREALAAVASAERAAVAVRYFKTGPGQYGEGDVFIGVPMPALRGVVKHFVRLGQDEIEELLDSPIHEHRLAGLLIMVKQFERASSMSRRDDAERDRLVGRYLDAVRRGRVNNWDLVDASAPALLGAYLLDRPRDVLFDLAASDVLWHRRVAIIATLQLIQKGDASTTLELAALLLDDRQDLMHKAVGWALRDVGKRVDRDLLIRFLDEHAARMPRVALSYATEHLDPELRAHYRSL